MFPNKNTIEQIAVGKITVGEYIPSLNTSYYLCNFYDTVHMNCLNIRLEDKDFI